MIMDDLHVNVVIFGGGAAGLWLLDDLRSQGYSALLLEASALGDGQTIASQGILHSGLKYSLQGWLTSAAREARDMPAIWRNCLLGATAPDLSATQVRSESFYLWGTQSSASRIGLLGARLGLRVTPKLVPRSRYPALLQRNPGAVYEVSEQVIAPESFVANLADRNRDAVLKIDSTAGFDFESGAAGEILRLRLRSSAGREPVEIAADWVVLTAGKGNGHLREGLGLEPTGMQCRPLHMILVRGDIPKFYGHCVDGSRTRVSITSATDSAGRVVWQIGGQVAEDGVAMDPASLIRHTQTELQAVCPALNLRGTEWSTYRIDRAEGETRSGERPDSFRLLREGNVLTAWPTKLVLVPQLAGAISLIVAAESSPRAQPTSALQSWPRPQVAAPPWERATNWLHYVSEDRAAA